MRAPTLALGAALAAGAVLAQVPAERPEPGAPGQEILAQAQVDPSAQPQDDTVPQPRFIRSPEPGRIEMTPLAPPGAPQEQTDQASTLPQVPEGVTVLPDDRRDTLPGEGAGTDALIAVPADEAEPVRQRHFKTAPDGESRPTRPDGPAVPINTPPTELRRGVRLRELDKMTGQTETFEIAVGETRQVDRLRIRLEACRSPESNDTHGTMAFLKVWDEREPDEEAFSGWMFAEAPSLSALDHPRYDVWVISCTTSAVAVSSPSE